MSEHLTVNIDPDEVIAPSTVIEVHTSRAMDPRSAQNALTLAGHPVTVELAKRGRVARLTVPHELPPGRHRLLVSELLDTKGRTLEESLVHPFVVSDLPELPDGVRVEHVVRARVDELALTRVPVEERGERVARFVKAVDRTTGEPMDLAFDEDGNRVDRDELRAAVAKRRMERYGRLEESLARVVEEADDDEVVPVTIWAAMPAEDMPELPDKDGDAPERRPRAEAALEPIVLPDWRRAADDAARLRVVIDQVASLTDLSAYAWHARLCTA